ncbi:DUF3800 domain-containing protein [Kocuria palustris]|uniref:DUF3800 domain-containing protein n=1 Tax=Kocuria palustris TaxID=71999 RepID=UPI0021A4C517|nr:DUF3800 domain-containing protein [Kocuria palustris]MCT1591707.1 DUF3800 domain-containing protein [Kocuria palustris]
MLPAVNIYCDESTHLENDHQKYLVLGAVACSAERARAVSERLFDIRAKHGVGHDVEIKWSKVSPAKLSFYLDIVDFFFDSADLKFRAVVADKSQLRHGEFQQTYDDWYYKMMFYLVRNLITPDHPVRIYLDKKDTIGGAKARKLHEVIANSQYDFSREHIERLQLLESHHVQPMQVADLLMGAVNYANRGLDSSRAKQAVVGRIMERTSRGLTTSTLPSETKFNIFKWQGR